MASNTRSREGRRGSRNAEAYFLWLVDKVQEDGHPRNTYWDLFGILHRTEFVWIVPNDDNRLEDGLDIRAEYFRIPREAARRFGPITVLEVIIGLSRRLAWLAEGSAEGWAWQLVCNLELHKFRDPLSKRKVRQVEEMLYALVWRTYTPDGVGGFFPLARPRGDQTKIEIWYQMHAYAKEIHPEY
jgi:hypothetical protein